MRELNIIEASWSVDAAGSWLKLRPELPGQAQMIAGEIDPQKKYTVTIKEFRKMRSLDANRYLWTLCNKLSVKVGIPPEEVYRHYIPDVGDNSDTICIPDAAVSGKMGEQGSRLVYGDYGVKNSGLHECHLLLRLEHLRHKADGAAH